MSVRYLQSDDDSATALLSGGQIDDGADSWWAGAQRCFAGIAIAAALAATALTTDLAAAIQQDPEEIPAGSLKKFTTPDEDFWDNPLNPISTTNYVELPYLPDPEEIPAGKLHGQPDEDFWDNPLNPIWVSNFVKAPWLSITGAPYQQLPYLPDPEEVPAGKLYGQPDEDFWHNPLNPISTTNYVKLPYLPELSDDLVLPSARDEDFWVNPVAPVPPSIYQPLPYLPDLSDDPAGSLYGLPEEAASQVFVVPGERRKFFQWGSGSGGGYIPPALQPGEDFWANPVVRQLTDSATIYQPLPIAAGEPADIIPPLVVFPPDEDYWQSPVAPVPASPVPSGTGASIYQRLPYLPDLSDDPASSLFGQPDEDFWANPVAPVPPTIYQRLPYLPDLSDDPAGSLLKFTSPDEDLWQNPVAPVSPTLYQPLPIAAGETGEILPPTVLPPDEDFWANPIAPVAPAIYQRLPYLPDLGDDPAGSLLKFTSPDEDFWTNQVAPAPPALYQRLPYLSDPIDDPAGSLRGQPDEDYWQNPVAPVPPGIYQKLPILPDLSDDPAASLYGQPDEDFWANLVVPLPPRIYQRLPYLPEISDESAGSLYGVPEETEWQNRVAPIPSALLGDGERSRTVAASVFQSLPYRFDAAEILLPPAFTPEEENGPPLPVMAGAQAARTWMQPAVYGFDEFSSYWWTRQLTGWAVRTHSTARGRESDSAARERLSRSNARGRTSKGVSRQAAG